MDQLKDVILSTLAEIQESVPPETAPKAEEKSKKEELKEPQKESSTKSKTLSKENFFSEVTSKKEPQLSSQREGELLFLNSLRERMLVLFEGFQAPNNTSIEAKIDLTLNFLEYLLSAIDERIEQIKGK
ncbi:FIG00469478: hypothetical protein [hydrothermal vent metagenome]|uniref:Campylobacter invasion antigen D C-terminal domain-containing protein n=1 Tax=hydrothermal vent metagenome TaxID=652676 RepID=A0A1W1B9N4_9ZZZZ